jgi:UDPglucose 6-dehydrogenase
VGERKAKNGAKFKIYDPKAMEEAKLRLGHIKENILMYCKDEYEACTNADALIIITEWNQFRSLELNTIKATMRGD